MSSNSIFNFYSMLCVVFAAPETQIHSKCSLLSDMFSLGLVICAVFNRGRSIIQAGNIPANYLKQLDTVSFIFQHKMAPQAKNFPTRLPTSTNSNHLQIAVVGGNKCLVFLWLSLLFFLFSLRNMQKHFSNERNIFIIFSLSLSGSEKGNV